MCGTTGIRIEFETAKRLRETWGVFACSDTLHCCFDQKFTFCFVKFVSHAEVFSFAQKGIDKWRKSAYLSAIIIWQLL